jgi:putative transposase
MEAAKVWTKCRDLHLAARKDGTKWPNKDTLQKATKGYGLHSQSAQMVCHAFLANIDTATQLRRSGRKEIRYPWRDKVFYPLMWPAQAVCVDGNSIVLPMGRGRKSIVLDKPDWLKEASACKLVWNGVCDELHVVVESEAAQEAPGDNHACIDLGQIHLATVVTNTGEALIVSGRGLRCEKRRMNKMHGSMAKKLSRCTKGSRRWKKLRRTRATQASRIERRVRDMRHKATSQAIDFCIYNKVGKLFVGNPDGVRRNRCGRKHNQRMSQWEYGRDINYLEQKSKKAAIECFNGSERGTSSRCPECGAKHKPKGRNWHCNACGFSGHRDVVGGANMHPLAFGEKIKFPSLKDITYLRPSQRRQGTGKTSGMNNQSLRSSSRSDTSLDGIVKDCAQLLIEGMESTTNAAMPWASQEAGQSHAISSEAHQL